MKIVVCVPIMNQEDITWESFKSFWENETTGLIDFVLIDNGSTKPLREWLPKIDKVYIIRNDKNVGVLPALNQGYMFAKTLNADFIYYSHNDVMMYEDGWDAKLMRILGEVSNVGVAGFYGAKGIGTHDIYKSPYVMQQLIRIENVSNCNRMDANHGYRNIRHGEWEEVAVMDGFSLIVNMQLLNKLGGLDTRTGIHHNYDNNICLDSLNNEYRNIVIAMDAQHLGGRTDVGEDWASPFGKTKQQVHEEAHYPFYEKWHPAHVISGNNKISLPVRVP